MEAPASKPDAASQRSEAARPVGSVRLGTDDLKSSYCNVCTVNSTREEVVLNFGVNQDWDRDRKEMGIQLQHRVILSPFGARRLHDRLTKLIQEYESRHGKLDQ